MFRGIEFPQRRTPLLVMVLMAVISACQAGGSPTTLAPTTTAAPVATAPPTTTAAGFPIIVTAANGHVTIGSRPEAIISLAPALTEMVAAVGALGQLVAVDDQSDYPAGIPLTDLSGFTPNIEAIASYQPDLVLVSNDIDGMVGALVSLDIPVLLLPAALTFDDIYAQIETVGAATGHVVEAAQLSTDLKARIDEIAVSARGNPPLTFYHELDPSLFSVTSSTFIGSVYTLVGLVNIADGADPDGFGYPQLSSEYIVDQDPDLIFLADTECCGQNATSVAQRPGWADLKAITGGGVVELSDDVASRWGPRIVDFVEAVAGAAARLQPVG